MKFTLSYGSSVVWLDTKGAYVISAVLDGKEAIKPSTDGSPTHGGIAVLAPYPGRVRFGRYTFEGRRYALPSSPEGHAKHGFAKDVEWKIIKKRRSSARLQSLLKGKGYPSWLETEVRYGVGRSSLSTNCSVRNVGKRDCPVVVGFHPYLLAEDWKMSTQGRAYRYAVTDRYFPTGERSPFFFEHASPRDSFDDCFRVAGEIRLVTEAHSLVMVRRNMPYIILFNGEPAEGRSLAVEPYTGLPDAFNNRIGLRTLRPGETFRCGYTLSLVRR